MNYEYTLLQMNNGDWLSFIEHQFVNGACPLFTAKISSEAILLDLLPKARHLSAFWSGFWLKIFIITIIQNENPHKNTQQFVAFGKRFFGDRALPSTSKQTS